MSMAHLLFLWSFLYLEKEQVRYLLIQPIICLPDQTKTMRILHHQQKKSSPNKSFGHPLPLQICTPKGLICTRTQLHCCCLLTLQSSQFPDAPRFCLLNYNLQHCFLPIVAGTLRFFPVQPFCDSYTQFIQMQPCQVPGRSIWSVLMNYCTTDTVDGKKNCCYLKACSGMRIHTPSNIFLSCDHFLLICPLSFYPNQAGCPWEVLQAK